MVVYGGKLFATVFLHVLLSFTMQGGLTENIGRSGYENSLAEDLEAWEPSREFSDNLRYYLSGFDMKGSPVWVVEYGKWDAAKDLVEKDEKQMSKYMDQFIQRIRKSGKIRPNETLEYTIIIDMGGFRVDRLNSMQALRFMYKTVERMKELVTDARAVYMINASFPVQTLWSVIRIFMGHEFSKVEVYGENPKNWRPILLSNIPANQLPESYGGIKDFKPMRMYG